MWQQRTVENTKYSTVRAWKFYRYVTPLVILSLAAAPLALEMSARSCGTFLVTKVVF